MDRYHRKKEGRGGKTETPGPAITDEKNKSSIQLLEKIGLRFKHSKEFAKNDNLLVFSSKKNSTENIKLDNLIQTFFEVFTNVGGKVPNLENLKPLLISEAKIINTTKGIPEIFSVEEFIVPREKLLTDGTLTDFKEYEISSKTEIFANIANRFSLYKKEGKLKGEAFEALGQKSFQFVKVHENWKIASVAWCDEVS